VVESVKNEIFDGFGLKYGLTVGILVTQRLSDRTRSTYLVLILLRPSPKRR